MLQVRTNMVCGWAVLDYYGVVKVVRVHAYLCTCMQVAQTSWRHAAGVPLGWVDLLQHYHCRKVVCVHAYLGTCMRACKCLRLQAAALLFWKWA
jgi:hypothetical protein